MTVQKTPDYNRSQVVWERPNVLLVEGPDDQAFAAKQMELLGSSSTWHVHFLETNTVPLDDVISVILKDRDFARVGHSISIMQDADLSAASTFRRLANAFQKTGLPVPSAHGVVASDSRWKTGVFVMPDGTSSGSLENLLLDAIPNPQRKALAVKYIQDAGAVFSPPPKPFKSTLQSYFAVHENFVKWISLALEIDAILPFDSPAFDPFRDFISDLEA